MSQNVNINLVPGNYPKEFHVSQYDVGRQLVANIVDSTGAYSIPSGATVTLVGTKPSGFGFTLSGSVGSGGVVTFSTTATVTAEYGRIPCEIRIESGNTVLGTANCMLIVEMSPHPEGTTDGDGEVIVNQITLLLEQITQQADRAVAASEAAQASETAAAASEANAATSESNAAASEATALNAKDDAVAAKTAAQASEQAAAESAAEAEATLGSYAKVGGEYDAMTVGTAKQLLSDSTTTDTEPYIYRQTAGDGDREEVEVVGGTVAWNQLIPIGTDKSKTQNGVTFTDNRDGSYTIQTTAEGASADAYLTIASETTNRGGHVTLLVGAPAGSSYEGYRLWDAWGGAGNEYGSGTTGKFAAGGQFEIRISVGSGTIITTPVKFTPQLFDITQMFGSAIANYFYDTLRLTSGASKAWFRKFFSKAIYAYNAGELMSVNTSAHNTVGFNQWDEEWESGAISASTGNPSTNANYSRSKNFCKILPNTAYYRGSSNVANFGMFFYDADKNYIGVNYYSTPQVFTTPSNAYYFKVHWEGTSYSNNICISLSWDGSRDGEYEPYVKHSYPLDDSLTLRGVPKLDSSNNLYYDGDTYESDGTVTRKYGIVDLGTLTWSYDNTVPRFASYSINTIAKGSGRSWIIANIICSKYKAVPLDGGTESIYGTGANKSIALSEAANISIKDTDYTDAAAFKTAMSGVYLVYELATATTETATPYTAIQVCDPDGTEEWIDERTVQIPVGNVTKYHANLKEKLEDLPTIPSAPSANGTYTLKATVSDGAVTYQWVNG